MIDDSIPASYALRAGITAGQMINQDAHDPMLGCLDAPEFVPAGSTLNLGSHGAQPSLAFPHDSLRDYVLSGKARVSVYHESVARTIPAFSR